MSYRGPTFVPEDEWKQLQQRRFDEITAKADLPSEPLRVKNEGDRLDELIKGVPLPSDQVRTQLEGDRFDRMTAAAKLPSAELADRLTNQAPDDASLNSPGVSSSVSSSPPENTPAAPDPDQDQNPVQRTLAYLRGLRPDAATSGGAGAAVDPSTGSGVGGDWGGGAGVGRSFSTDPAERERVGAGLPPRAEPVPDYPLPDAVAKGVDAVRGLVTGAQALDERTFGPAAERQLDEMAARHAAATGVPVDEARRQITAAYDAAMSFTGEPLHVVGGAMRAVRGLAPLAEHLGQPGMSLEATGGPPEPSKAPITQADIDAMLAGVPAEPAVASAPPRDLPLSGPPPPDAAPRPLVEPFTRDATAPAGPGVVYHDEVDLPQGPSDFRKAWDRSRNVLGSLGDSGAELAQRISAWRDGWKDTAGDWVTRMPEVWAIKKPAEFANLVDVLEGTAKPASDRIASAAAQARSVLDDVYALAQNAGVEVGPQVENYFPHRYPTPVAEQLGDARRRAQVAEELLGTGQVSSVDEAKQVMLRYLQSPKARRNGSLEVERLANLAGYDKTPDVLVDHLVSAAKRIHEVAQFGQDDAIVGRLFDGMRAAGYDEKTLRSARDLFQVVVGAKDYEGAPLPTLASGLRKYNAITRLGWAGIANATQGANTATVTGVVRTLQSVPKAIWSPADKEFALRAGVTLDNVIQQMRSTEGQVSDRLASKVMPGFATIERFNRTLTAIAGRDFAVDQAARAAAGDSRARRALEALGLDAAAIVRRGGKLDAAEQRAAARSVDIRTQFQVDPQDLPGWADSPWGKVVAQFRSFSYNQSAFVVREVLAPALRSQDRDVRPLVRFAILAPLASIAATEAKNAGQGREPEHDPVKRAGQYVLGPLGVAGDVARAVLPINGANLPAERQASMIAGAALGPSLGTLTDVAGGLVNLERGKALPALRTAARQVPFLGPLIQNYVLPDASTDAPATPPAHGGGRSSGRSSGR